MTFQQIQEWWIDFEIHTLQGIPRSVPGPLAIGKKENKPAKKEIDNRVKYTTGGMPYKEIEPSGCEVSAWKILNNKQDKGSTALSDNELTAARQKGFAVDTIIQVKRFGPQDISK